MAKWKNVGRKILILNLPSGSAHLAPGGEVTLSTDDEKLSDPRFYIQNGSLAKVASKAEVKPSAPVAEDKPQEKKKKDDSGIPKGGI